MRKGQKVWVVQMDDNSDFYVPVEARFQDMNAISGWCSVTKVDSTGERVRVNRKLSQIYRTKDDAIRDCVARELASINNHVIHLRHLETMRSKK